jgi:hypothetical protein
MRAQTWWLAPWAAGALVCTLGCGGFGRVHQGRVVAYQPEEGLLTVILDSNVKQPGKPRYDVLPPETVRVPRDPNAMGPPPQAGGLLELDLPNRRVVVFDAVSQSLQTIRCEVFEVAEGVGPNDPRVAGLPFPQVDRVRRSVTLYWARQRRLVTFTIPEEYLALPDSAWIWGDEVRYYFKDPGQALRLMNLSKTEIS